MSGVSSISGPSVAGIESIQARISELAALTGTGGTAFASLLESAVPNGRGPRIWADEDAASSGTTGASSEAEGAAGVVADRPASWPPATTGTGTTTGTGSTTATGTSTGTGSTTDTGAATGTYAALPAAGEPWMAEIEHAAAANGIDPALLAAVVWTESGFQPDAVSPAGAVGLTQLMPGTAATLGVDPTDPVQALDGGARLLAQLLQRYGGDPSLALAAYNAGPGRVDAAGGVPAIAETQRFVATVQDRWALLAGAAATTTSTTTSDSGQSTTSASSAAATDPAAASTDAGTADEGALA
jgi:hypothetical protein